MVCFQCRWLYWIFFHRKLINHHLERQPWPLSDIDVELGIKFINKRPKNRFALMLIIVSSLSCYEKTGSIVLNNAFVQCFNFRLENILISNINLGKRCWRRLCWQHFVDVGDRFRASIDGRAKRRPVNLWLYCEAWNG